jgi:hypothetical protein
MPAVSTDNANLIRRRGGAIDPIYLAIWPLEIAATARVNGTLDYNEPVTTIPIDTISTDFLLNTRRGMVVHITRSGVLIYRGVMRLPPTATELYLEAIREGDTGTAELFATSIADNDDVTIYTARIPGSSLSYLDETGELFKRRDVPFDPVYPQSQYPEPHARFGPHRHIRIAPGGTATLEFSDTSIDFKGDALDRVWRPPDDFTQTVGDEFDADVTYTAPAGNYLMGMTARRADTPVEDTDSALGFRYVMVTDGPNGDNPAFSDLYQVSAAEIRADRVGVTATFEIKCNAGDETGLLNYLYPGAFCLFQETPRHSADGWATEGEATAGEVTTFCGHLRRYDRVSVDYRGVQTWRVTFESWLKYAAALPMPTQVVRVATPPTEWYEAHPDLMDIGAILWLWIFYHTDMGRLYDIYFEDVRNFHLPRTSVDRGTLLGSFQQIMEWVTGGNIGCASDGALYARRHGSFETDATRDAIPTVWTWNAGDIEGGLEVSRDPLMKVGQLRGAGIVSTTSDAAYYAFAAEAGYLAQAQAVGRQEMQSFIAFSASDVDARVGHAWTNMNRPVEYIPVTVLGQRDVIEPALMEWHVLNVGTYAPLEKEAFGTTRRVLPLTVSRTYAITPTGVTKRITAQFEPETKGKPAIRVRQLNTGTMEPGAVIGDAIEPTPPEPEEPLDPCDALDMSGYTRVLDFCFRESDYGMIPDTFSEEDPHWVAGEGWKSGFRIATSVGYRQTSITFPRAWANQTLNSMVIRVEYTLSLGTSFGGTGQYLWLTGASGVVTHINLDRTTADSSQPTYTTSPSNRNFGPGDVRLQLTAGQAFDADPGGEATIHRITFFHNESSDPYTILPGDV